MYASYNLSIHPSPTTMTKKCKPTQVRNPKTGRCVLKSGAIGKALRKTSTSKEGLRRRMMSLQRRVSRIQAGSSVIGRSQPELATALVGIGKEMKTKIDSWTADTPVATMKLKMKQWTRAVEKILESANPEFMPRRGRHLLNDMYSASN